MSLTVPPALLEKARRGPVSDDDFIECIRESLPYAWAVVSEVAERLATGGGPLADHRAEPPDEAARAQVFRLVGSDAMRAAIERHFNVRLAFRNCRLAMFDPAAHRAYGEFTSPRAQLLDQSTEFVAR